MTSDRRHYLRIDNRLLHGQVVQFWIPYLEIEHLIIADDLAAANPAMSTVYRMAVPRRIRLSVVSIIELAQAAREENALPTLIILSDIFDLARAFMSGFHCPRITLGNIHSAIGRNRITDTIYLTPEEKHALAQFHRDGRVVEIQTFPGEPLRLSLGKSGALEWERA
ncbi:MAG: PTS sugar transporter subunit IIB [Proteobacteria bacterium]|nr:PTS sugar transporter subunit IIB [Pseudomonadota bacterium]